MLTRSTIAEGESDRGSALEFAVVMVGVFVLLSLGLVMVVNFLAAQAASTAAQRGLEVAQTPGYSTDEVAKVVDRLTTSSGIISSSRPEIVPGPQTVRVVVQVQTVLGSTLSRTATGPMLRFVPQGRP